MASTFSERKANENRSKKKKIDSIICIVGKNWNKIRKITN